MLRSDLSAPPDAPTAPAALTTADAAGLGLDVEQLRDDLARERLARRAAERWLTHIKETLRPYWQDGRSNWDGSLCGLPTEVMGVARMIEELRARVAELEAELEARERVLHGRIANLTARLSACLDCLPAGMTGGPIP
jgi:hypothetical protein